MDKVENKLKLKNEDIILCKNGILVRIIDTNCEYLTDPDAIKYLQEVIRINNNT